MNSSSLHLRAPASSILTRPGYVMGYPHSFKEQEMIMGGSLNPQIPMHIPSENSQYNLDFGRGMKTLSAPSMSTPLNAFQTTNTQLKQQPDRFGFVTKSITSSLNAPNAPQRLSSFSQMPYSSMNIPLHAEHNFNSVNSHSGFLHSGTNPAIQGTIRNNTFQNQAQYTMQPQIMPPQYMLQQKAFQFQSQQSQFGAPNERHMGFANNHMGFNHLVPNQFPNLKQIPPNHANTRTFDHNIIRMNTYSAGIQPQVMHPSSFQNNRMQIAHRDHDFSQKFAPDIRRTDQTFIASHLQTQNLTLPVTGGVTIKGYKPTVVTENQDKSLIIELGPNACAYAVFDGHGPHGDVVADFVSNKFTTSITQLLSSYVGNPSNQVTPPTRQQIKNFFIVLFHNMDLQLSELKYGISMWSGCTAAICIRIFNEVHIAWVGDSRVVIYKFSKPNSRNLNSMEVDASKEHCEPSISWWTTSDHVPNRPDELSRITDCGASITVYSTPWLNKSTTRIREHGIAMSRSFGDKAGTQFGVICKPDMASIKLKSDDQSVESEYKWAIVVASDGIWDSLSEEEIGYKIMKDLIWKEDESSEQGCSPSKDQRPTQEDVTRLASSLSSEAWNFRASVENYSDDTTLVISIL